MCALGEQAASSIRAGRKNLKLLILGKDGGGNLSLSLGGYFGTLLAEIQVALGLEGDKVDVSVGHFHTQHGHANALAGHCGLEGHCHLARKGPEAGIHIGIGVGLL